MTLDDTIKQVLELDEKAANGPWNYTYDGSGDYSIGPGDPQIDRTCHIWATRNDRPSENAPLIAHYRTSAPLLARACQRMKEIIEFEAQCGYCQGKLICEDTCPVPNQYGKRWRTALAEVDKMFGG